MNYIYWHVRAFDVNEEKRTIYSPQFTDVKYAELWKMKYIIEHPDDRILFELMQEGGERATDVNSVISDMWVGHQAVHK